MGRPSAFQAGARQASLAHAALDQLVAQGKDVAGDALQERRPLFQAGFPIAVERRLGQGASTLQVIRAGTAKTRRQGLASGGGQRMYVAVAATHAGLADQQLSCYRHGLPL